MGVKVHCYHMLDNIRSHFLDRSYLRSSREKLTSILEVFQEHAPSFANKQIVCYNVSYLGCFFAVFDNKCVNLFNH